VGGAGQASIINVYRYTLLSIIFRQGRGVGGAGRASKLRAFVYNGSK